MLHGEESEEPDSVYMTLPEGITRDEAINNYISSNIGEEKPESYSDEVVKITKGAHTSQPVTLAEKNWKEMLGYGLIQAVSMIHGNIDWIVGIYVGGVCVFLLYHSAAMFYYSRKRKQARILVENKE